MVSVCPDLYAVQAVTDANEQQSADDGTEPQSMQHG